MKIVRWSYNFHEIHREAFKVTPIVAILVLRIVGFFIHSLGLTLMPISSPIPNRELHSRDCL